MSATSKVTFAAAVRTARSPNAVTAATTGAGT